MGAAALVLASCSTTPVTETSNGTAIELTDVQVNGVELRVAEAGPEGGPLIVFVHGWPELWYSWRYQIPALVEAGYHVIAPDMRG